jgi:trehalose-phosphatase
VTAASAPDGDLQGALAAFAQREAVLVAVDFDGTLAPIVLDPSTSRPLPEASAALRALSRSPGTSVALVSGRTLADLRRLAEPPEGAALVGSHGAEVHLPIGGAGAGPADAAAGATAQEDVGAGGAELLQRLAAELAAITGRYAGTSVELKPTSAVLHTRGAPPVMADGATRETLAGPATWPGVHVTRGKEVVELAVTDVTKGRALQGLRAALGLPDHGGVLYLGDDVTDERAFDVLDDAQGDLTIKVGEGPTAARHRLAGPPEVALTLARLAELRAARGA